MLVTILLAATLRITLNGEIPISYIRFKASNDYKKNGISENGREK